MRIVILSNLYPPYYIGGYELACQAVVEGLRERGHRVTVLTSTYGIRQSHVNNGVHRKLTFHLFRNDEPMHRLLLAEWLDNRYFRGLIKQEAPDVIYVWGMRGLSKSLLISANRTGHPVAYMIQDRWLEETYYNDRWLTFWQTPRRNHTNEILRQILLRTGGRQMVAHVLPIYPEPLQLRHVCFASQYNKMRTERSGFKIGNSVIVYNGIDIERFITSDKKPNGPLRLLYVGQLMPHKGVHTALEAITILKHRGYNENDFHLQLVGASLDTDYVSRLTEIVEQDGLQTMVHFCGAISHAQMPDLYRAHDVLLFTSVAEEGFPLVLLEAMASRLAVVGTNVGGPGEILRHEENALVFPPESPYELANQIERLRSQPTLRCHLAKNGFELVKSQFTIHSMINGHESFLRSILI